MEKERLELLWEDMNSKFELVLEGHAALHKEIQNVKHELTEKIDMAYFMIKTVNQKVDVLDQRLDRVEQRLDKVEQRLDKVEQRLDKVEQKIDMLDQKIDDNTERLSQKIDNLTHELSSHRTDKKVHHLRQVRGA